MKGPEKDRVRTSPSLPIKPVLADWISWGGRAGGVFVEVHSLGPKVEPHVAFNEVHSSLLGRCHSSPVILIVLLRLR